LSAGVHVVDTARHVRHVERGTCVTDKLTRLGRSQRACQEGSRNRLSC
jgi:hypothetical protein